MKPIKITAKTAEIVITQELSTVQNRCTVRTIDFRDIQDSLASIEARLNVPKKHLDGTTVIVDVHGQDFPSAYRHIPESTQFRAEFSGGAWRIIRIYRGICKRYNQRVICSLSESAKQAILDRMSTFCI